MRVGQLYRFTGALTSRFFPGKEESGRPTKQERFRRGSPPRLSPSASRLPAPFHLLYFSL
jgi:hypothetical protein